MSQFSRTITQHEIDAMKTVLMAIDGDASLPRVEPTAYEKEVSIMQDYIDSVDEALTQPVHERIRDRIVAAGDNYYSNSNISDHIHGDELNELVDEATTAFEKVLDVLVIDRENDPNAMDTGHRLAKMYIRELMSGRYTNAPKITAFPNQHTGKDTGFNGMLVVRSEIKSMCSHHHQIVDGVAYIGIIPKGKVIGLSKYTRLAQHLARRGTLQEELAQDILDGIKEFTGSDDVAVYVEATHGCCENRGIGAHNSNTQTTVLDGEFMNDPTLRKEFHDNVMFQKLN